MAARVIHFGPDECHRLMVLRTAGYSVSDCPSVVQLRSCLAAGALADALLLSDAQDWQPQEAIALARSQSELPIILFRSTTLAYDDLGVDLVVHCLTPPEVWLNQVDAIIENSRAIRARSQVLAKRSEQLRRESQAIIRKARQERERSRRECAKSPVAGIGPASECPSPGKQMLPKFSSK